MKKKIALTKIIMTLILIFTLIDIVYADTCQVDDSNGFCLVTDPNIHVEIKGKNYFGENLSGDGLAPGNTYFKISSDNNILYCSNGTLGTNELTDPLEPIDKNCIEKTNNKKSLIYAYEYGYGEYIKEGEYKYNTKYLTGNPIEDYYITQTAVWNFSPPTDNYLLEIWNKGWFKNYNFSEQTYYGLKNETITKISNLINDASNKASVVPSLKLNVSNNTMKLTQDGKYYISNEINIIGENLNKEIAMNISGAPNAFVTKDPNATSGISIISDGTNPTISEKIYVKVPIENITDNTINIELSVESESAINDNSKIIECHPSEDMDIQDQQPMIIYKPGYSKLTDKITLFGNMFSVTISKKSIVGEEELPGATLKITDQNGNIVKDLNGRELEWISTSESQTFYLSEGTYILSETIAPEGYELSETTIKFTINDKGIVLIDDKEVKDNLIIFRNTPEATQVPTGNAITYIAGAMCIVSLGVSVYFIIKRKKI